MILMSSSILPAPASGSAHGVFTDTTPSNIAVSVRGVAKSYSIAKNAEKHSTLGEALLHKLRRPLAKPERETFWALNDVSFDIAKGDVVGIIGRNGAGKSTLLKILSRITEPTRGRIDLYGRVGSLLEVGTGFHPELTGRENIFLNGAILGMQKSEIARQFDAIVDFSGTAQFLDTPVKRYSSGMYVRLAFAVAAHLNPEILIVDEVLAVGDAEFQKKCLGKMQDVADSGRTVLFVSHNMGAVTDLCSKAILMSGGRMLKYGTTDQIIHAYLGDAQLDQLEVEVKPAPGFLSEAVFTGCRITDLSGSVLKSVDVNSGFRLSLDVKASEDVDNVEVTVRVGNALGHPLFTANISNSLGKLVMLNKGFNQFDVDLPGHFLAAGNYSVYLALHQPNVKVYHAVENAIIFTVEETGSDAWQYGGAQLGDILVRFPWRQPQQAA